MCRAVWMNVVFMIYMSISELFKSPCGYLIPQFFLLSFGQLLVGLTCYHCLRHVWCQTIIVIVLTIAPAEKTNFIRKNSTRWNKGKPVSWVFRISRVVKNISFLKSMLLGDSYICSVFSVVAELLIFTVIVRLLLIFKSTVELERRGKKIGS